MAEHSPEKTTLSQVGRLREITRLLREPGGCQWDRAQDYDTMRPHLIEEAYEIIDAVDRRDFDALREELGDLLFLILFYVQLAAEEKRFDLEDIARTAGDKLIRRHPHVFSDTRVNGVKDILRNWEEIKRREKGLNPGDSGQPPSAMGDRRDYLPALLRASKIQHKAARVGFDWEEASGVLSKVHEELAELAELNGKLSERPSNGGGSRADLEEELGDVLFSVVNLARHLKVNPELALQAATDKFIRRFRAMEILAHGEERNLNECTAAEREAYWERVKSDEIRTNNRNAPGPLSEER